MTSFNKVLTSLIQLLALSGGRDKFCRVVQYFCKFLAARYRDNIEFMVSHRPLLKIKAEKAQSLMGAMAMTRKVLRFGPSINTIKIVISNINQLIEHKASQPDHIVVLKTLSAFFLGMFFLCDHYLWFYKVGLVNNTELKTKFEYYSSLGWFLDCITCIIKNIALYNQMKPEQRKTKSIPLAIDMVRVVLDTPVSYSFVKPGSVDGKVVGILGTITSLIGIYQMWK